MDYCLDFKNSTFFFDYEVKISFKSLACQQQVDLFQEMHPGFNSS